MFKMRSDATLVRDVHPYRRMMQYLMPRRNDSAFMFEQQVDLTKTNAFLEQVNESREREDRVTLLHLVIWGLVRAFANYPDLNRFTAGNRLWQRNGIWITYSAMKRLTPNAPLVMVKREFDPSLTFDELVEAMNAQQRVERSDEKSHVDKELALVLRLPGPILRVGLRVVRWLDALGVLPKSFVNPDPMFSSAVVANLGSIKVRGGYHHMYEYGNCPAFVVTGEAHDVPVAIDGNVVVRNVVKIGWTYDERIADGLYAKRGLDTVQDTLEDPLAAGAATGPLAVDIDLVTESESR